MATQRVRFAPVTDTTAIASITAGTTPTEVTLNGTYYDSNTGKVVLLNPYQFGIVSDADETGKTFIITGTNDRGQLLTESVTGGALGVTVYTTAYFRDITKIEITGTATIGNVSIGVEALKGVSQWILNTSHNANVGLSISLDSGSNLTYTVYHTMAEIFDPNITDAEVQTHNHEDLILQTASDDGNYMNAFVATRVELDAYTTGALYYVVKT